MESGATGAPGLVTQLPKKTCLLTPWLALYFSYNATVWEWLGSYFENSQGRLAKKLSPPT